VGDNRNLSGDILSCFADAEPDLDRLWEEPLQLVDGRRLVHLAHKQLERVNDCNKQAAQLAHSIWGVTQKLPSSKRLLKVPLPLSGIWEPTSHPLTDKITYSTYFVTFFK